MRSPSPIQFPPSLEPPHHLQGQRKKRERKNYSRLSNSGIISNDPLLGRLHTSRLAISVVIAHERGVDVVAGELFESLALRLGDAERGEDAEEHEERVDLHDVALVRVGGSALDGALGAQLRDTGLADDGADLAHAGGETVRGGAVAGREALAGDDEGGCVGT
jgi:hypothetical protein